MLKRLHYMYMVAALVLTGRMFAAADASSEGLVEIAMKATTYPVVDKVNPFNEGWAYAIKGTDGKQIGYAGRLIRMANGTLIPEFKFVILDADVDCSPTELCKRPSCTSYMTRRMGPCYSFKNYESGGNIFVGLQRVTSRWQLISAAPSGHKHAELEGMVLPTFPARTAAQLLKNNGITCVVIDIEAYKQSGREQSFGRSVAAIIDLDTVELCSPDVAIADF